MRTNIAWLVGGVLALGCQPAPDAGFENEPIGASLEDDYVIDPDSLDRVDRFDQAATVGDGPGGAHILFLNFDGATITRGSDNSALNRSFIPNASSIVVPKFDDTKFAAIYTRQQAIDEILKYSRAYYAPFNVEIVTVRPASGRYTMIMVGGTATLVGSGGGVVGIAPLDCGNNQETNVGYAFSASLVGSNRTSKTSADRSLNEIAVTIVHEAGHSYGLEHVQNTSDIMYPSVNINMVTFAGSAATSSQKSCGSGTTQNTGQTLITNLGMRTGAPLDFSAGPADAGTVDAGKDAGKDGGLNTPDLANNNNGGGDLAQPAGEGDMRGGVGGGGGDGSDRPSSGCSYTLARASQPNPLALLAFLPLLVLARKRRRTG